MFSTINRVRALVAAGVLVGALGAAAVVPLTTSSAVAPTAVSTTLLAKHGADDPVGHAKHGADDPAGHGRHGADDPVGHA